MKATDENDRHTQNVSEVEANELLNELDKIAQQYGTETQAFAESESEETGLRINTKLKINTEAKQSANLEDLKHNHLRFYLTGHTLDSKKIDIKNLIPALNAPFLNISQLRYDFPLIIKNSEDKWVESLKEYIDRIVIESNLNSDQKEHLKRSLLKLEIILKKYAEKYSELTFSEVWHKAVNRLHRIENSNHQATDPIKNVLRALPEKFDSFSMLVPFSKNNDVVLVRAARLHNWRKRMVGYLSELDDQIEKLKNIISTAKKHSEESYKPGFLQESIGKTESAEVDFDSLSEIVSQSFTQETVPETRISRIQDTLDILKRWQKIIASQENSEKYLIKLLADSTQKALKLYSLQKDELIAFFRAIRIGRLEVEHRYDEQKHNEFFEDFSSLYLTEEEWACFPPILLYFKASEIKHTDKSDLVDLLSSKMPIKVLLTVDDLYNSSAVFDESFYSPGWPALLGKMAISLNNAFVLQFPLSHAAQVSEEIEQGIEFNGPSLFSVFDGFDQEGNLLHPYIRSASAAESRAFPIFTFNPAAGGTWLQRFSIEKSSQHEEIWPKSEIFIEDTKEDQKIEIVFSLAEFLAGIDRYESHFLPLGSEEWHEDMVPLTEFINSDKHPSATAVPYFLMADKDGFIFRIIVTKTLCKLCTNAQQLWRTLQELGGIGNSHVLNQLKKERVKLEEKMNSEITKIKETHNKEMERSLSDLTNEIISNIAAGLLSDDIMNLAAGESAPAITQKVTKVDTKTVEPEKESAKAEEITEPVEEEDLSINDPYIDTPLCTSCNDCRNINSDLFQYDENKQAFIANAKAGTFKDLVEAAEKCPVRIIHPGKPLNPDEPGLDELIKIAEKYN